MQHYLAQLFWNGGGGCVPVRVSNSKGTCCAFKWTQRWFLTWIVCTSGLVISLHLHLSFLLWDMLLLQNNNFGKSVVAFPIPCSYPVIFSLGFSSLCFAALGGPELVLNVQHRGIFTFLHTLLPSFFFLHWQWFFNFFYWFVFLQLTSYPARSNIMAKINILFKNKIYCWEKMKSKAFLWGCVFSIFAEI